MMNFSCETLPSAYQSRYNLNENNDDASQQQNNLNAEKNGERDQLLSSSTSNHNQKPSPLMNAKVSHHANGHVKSHIDNTLTTSYA